MSPLEQLPNTYRTFFGKFSALTVAQKALIRPILDGRDVILQAGTGLGKTEAVLAPATEKLLTHSEHFTIVYIVPTRALALDMNRRIKPLYRQLGLKSGMRTGDGKTQQEGKPHLLILTPESLDVLLGSQNVENKYFLKHVRVMVIDEVHLFLHDERGHQLSYLRRRLEIQALGELQTLTLSATISGCEEITSFFNLKKNVFYYQQPGARRLEPCWVHIEDEASELIPFFDDLFLRWRCQKLLVFANSRKKCEHLFKLLNQEGIFSQNILLHYSNLSTKERRCCESSFRDRKKGICIATSTLEMGIDIGDVDGIVLIGPPPSTMAFLQRIGRGNRREQHVSFWGICQGAGAEYQLLRFLALFELARENLVEKPPIAVHYSVLFQQILSCLYAKKVTSQSFLNGLFQTNDLHEIFHEMLDKNWLKQMPQPTLYCGGWRYGIALKKQKIWGNFPPTDEEYDVILEEDKIASLPLAAVKQLEIGDHIQLTGKVLKVLRIEEKKAIHEVWVKDSDQAVTKELIWCGCRAPTSFEVAQKVGLILLDKREFQGLTNRSRQLLEKSRKQITTSLLFSNGVRVHRLSNGAYRYETFLGSVGNFIVHHLIKERFFAEIEDFSVHFDEIGIETNEWISWEGLEFPYSIPLFQSYISSHLPLLKQAFSWNSWLHWLPEDLQKKEICSYLCDPRLLEQFERYHKESKHMTPPHFFCEDNEVSINCIPLKGEPWSVEKEKQVWGKLSFPEIPSESQGCSLTATQVQVYITQKLCPRWARFQHLNFTVKSHPRFHESDQNNQLRRQEGINFKKNVIAELRKKNDLRWESADFILEEAIQEVILSQKSLFLAQAKLKKNEKCGLSLKGSPDLIYLKYESSHICAEVWDIKNGHTFTYAQKWRIAFYAYLLEGLLKEKTFSLPVKLSDLGGLIYRHIDNEKLFEHTPFLLTHFIRGMPHLIAQWKADATQSADRYSMDSACTSCDYFSYCYQETLFNQKSSIVNDPTIVSLEKESNDFPKNSKHWFFLSYNKEGIRWQCWENQESISDSCILIAEYPNWHTFQEEIIKRLLKEWHRSTEQGKNPHFLVYEPSEWYLFHTAFRATPLQTLWKLHSCWTSIQSVLQKHFLWPIQGRLTATQVGRCLGLISDPSPPLSLYHSEMGSFDLYRDIWSWCLSRIKSRRTVPSHSHKTGSVQLINTFLAIQHREHECRSHEILEFQKKPLSERVENFRAIGPITFISTAADGHQQSYTFAIDPKAPVSKFRVGDFLKLSCAGTSHIQDGYSVVLTSYSPEKEILSLRSMSQKMALSKKQAYALDECATDWNAPKIDSVLNRLKDPKYRPELIQMLHGHTKSFHSSGAQWAEQWYHSHAHLANLNFQQTRALMLPFLANVGLIEGPPGTGKTHTLVWTLIALIAHARSLNRKIKILITALTHQAIDQILRKLAKAFHSANVDNVLLWKYGRYDQEQFAKLKIQPLIEPTPLNQNRSLILGATGFGIYQLLEGKNFPQLFDWVVFDESSQLLPSYSCLSLIFSKGNALFYGDTQQLPPVLIGHYESTSLSPRSILQELISRTAHQNRVRLNETYRMNDTICRFVSRHWYESELCSVVAKEKQKLKLPHYPLFHDRLDEDLDPSKEMVLVLLEHEGCVQSSEKEALWITKAVKRLIENYAISVDEIGIISPHRLQNNTISAALKATLPPSAGLPKIDTVERMQGEEFDVVIFSATVSDRATIHSAFLKDYRRFNVAVSRSRKKFLFVTSFLFFHSFPMTEKELIAHFPFDDFSSVTEIIRQQGKY